MNKRRPTISRILAVTCALSIFAGAFASAPSKPATFSDVQPGDWFYPYVTEMAELDAVPEGLKSPLAFTPLMMPLLYIQMIQSS